MFQVCVGAAVCLIMNDQHLKESHKSGHFDAGSFERLFFFSFSSAFFHQDMPFLFAPLTVPQIPLPAPITESWGLGIGLEPRPCL